ncbi:MAG: hypothetical protein FRX49_09024 [Trebouxia sp. A1-2]|nr:MAG: hypothetical protein FRX49_09024 [Trebouxia sp. A1-2]
MMQLTDCERGDGMEACIASHIGTGQSPETNSGLAAAIAASVARVARGNALAEAAAAAAAAAAAGLFCEVVAIALGFKSIPGASSAARSSELVGEGGGEGVEVGVLVPRLGPAGVFMNLVYRGYLPKQLRKIRRAASVAFWLPYLLERASCPDWCELQDPKLHDCSPTDGGTVFNPQKKRTSRFQLLVPVEILEVLRDMA